MREFHCPPGTEVSGQTLLAILQNLQAEDIAPFLDKYGLADIQPNKWYSEENFLNLLNELNSATNSTPNFVAIGMSIVDVSPMPPGLKNPTLVDMLQSLDEHYQLAHRHGDVGHKTLEKIGGKEYKITLDHCMYPDDLEYGVLYGFAKHFLPPRTLFKVWYDEAVQRMDKGGTQTVLHVRWE